MEILFFAIGVGILGYLAFVFLFPKTVGDETTAHTKNALKDIYETTLSNEEQSGSNVNVLKNDLANENPIVQGFYSLPLLKKIYPYALQAGFHRHLLTIMVIIIGLFFFFTFMLISVGMGPMSLIFAALFSYFLPLMYFRRRVRKRNEAFIFLFPDVLDMIVRSVRSGFPINSALKMVAENMENPVKDEFQQVVNEIAMGRTLTQSLTRLGQRINEPDIHFFIVVLNVQQETGGNLAEVVSNLSQIIRKRKQLRLKIKAMTSEGRATALILGSLPFVVFFALWFVRRDYLEPLWTETAGMFVLGGALGLVALAMIIVNSMINIDI